MRNILFIIVLTITVSVGAEDLQLNQPLMMKNGSYLFINHDTMRMVDKNGKPVEMKDGIEMELSDGTIIMMENNKIWQQIYKDKKK
jgi:hypothetical protein